MPTSINKFYGIIDKSYHSMFADATLLNPSITDIIFLNIIYKINNIKSLYEYISNVDLTISSTLTIERVLEKFSICYLKIIIDNLDLFTDILLIYFNKILNYNTDYNNIYRNLKLQLKKKNNHQIIYNIKKSINKY